MFKSFMKRCRTLRAQVKQPWKGDRMNWRREQLIPGSSWAHLTASGEILRPRPAVGSCAVLGRILEWHRSKKQAKMQTDCHVESLEMAQSEEDHCSLLARQPLAIFPYFIGGIKTVKMWNEGKNKTSVEAATWTLGLMGTTHNCYCWSSRTTNSRKQLYIGWS